METEGSANIPGFSLKERKVKVKAATNQLAACQLPLSFYFPAGKKETEKTNKINVILCEHMKMIFGSLYSPHIGMHEMAITHKKIAIKLIANISGTLTMYLTLQLHAFS